MPWFLNNSPAINYLGLGFAADSPPLRSACYRLRLNTSRASEAAKTMRYVRRRAARRLTSCVALLLPAATLTAAAAALAASAPSAQAPEQGATLVPADERERHLAAGQVHTYRVDLERGQFLHVIVAQHSVDVAIALAGPAASLEIDTQTDSYLREELVAVAETPGLHTITIRPANGRFSVSGAGRYRIRVEALRPASAMDRLHAAAERHFEEATRIGKDRRPGDWPLVRKNLEAALTLYRESGRRLGEMKTRLRMGHFQLYARAYADAAAAMDEALAVARALSDEAGVAAIQTARGFVLGAIDDLPGARDATREAAAAHGALGNTAWQANSLNAHGVMLRRSGSAEEGIEYQMRALAAARRAGALTFERDILNNLGISYKDLGDYRTAARFYEQALAAIRGVDEPARAGGLLNNIGNLYRLLGEHTKALELHTQALAFAEQAEDRENAARSLNTIGLTHYELGHYSEALDYHERALAIRRELRDPIGEASALDGAGMARHRLGDSEAAIASLHEALAIRRSTGERYSESHTLVHIALVERDRGNLARALEHVEAAVALADSLRSTVVSPDLRASFVASEQEPHELHIDVLMRLHAQRPHAGYAVRALEAAERGRARVLLESLAEGRADIRQGIEPALLAEERALQRKLDDASSRISRLVSRQSAPRDIEAARSAIEALNTEYRQLQVRIRKESPTYAALTQPRSLGVAEIQRELLDPDTILLEYVVAEDRSWLWTVTPGAVASFELPPRRDIDAAAREMYNLLTARQPRPGESAPARGARIARADRMLRRQSAALGKMLLGPAAAHLGTTWRGKRLLVVAADVLEYLPFTALGDPATAQPLIAGHEVVNLPSASVLAVLREGAAERARPPKTLAVFADPVFEPDDPRVSRTERREAAGGGSPADRALRSFESVGETRLPRLTRLPFSRQEARAISGLVPPAARLEATDFEATRVAATSGALGEYRLVHFATHGFLNSEHPELSGLVLSLVDRDGRAQDGFLRLNDIYNLRLPADVVVLSACQTALGRAIRGEGLVGLTRGFMYAGARRVVASLWQVDDLATAELMRLFYRGMLQDGLRPAAALRNAQRGLARQPRWASPFFWSAFVLQGEWQ